MTACTDLRPPHAGDDRNSKGQKGMPDDRNSKGQKGMPKDGTA